MSEVNSPVWTGRRLSDSVCSHETEISLAHIVLLMLNNLKIFEEVKYHRSLSI